MKYICPVHDFLITGFGLAGATLAKTLKDAGADVVVTDFEDGSSSSRVAAGLCNPITGRNFALTWRANEIFPFLRDYYQKVGDVAGVSLFHPMPVYRICASVRELNEWSNKSGDAAYAPFVTGGFDADPEIVDAPWGIIGTTGGGYVNIPKYLDVIREELGSNYHATDRLIEPDDLQITDSSVTWKNVKARHLILCEGYLAYQRMFYSYLPFTPMKGEILELHIPGLYRDRILVRGGFVLPFENNIHLAGASYDGKNFNSVPTDAARKQILDRLASYVKLPVEVTGHRAGVRPAVKDRRPLVGTHSQFKNVHLFNGMGSKGTSLSPYLAALFTDYLLNGKELPEEVDLHRFVG